ncbi:SEN1 N terminal-domain-containing protein [Ampelomyces quisqualis]|uniref:SEN1 N terminal-domain-containing protein n=1 Tax=Ampelomyces quisqualis TaxID=50730 RepID=A0A6A5QPP2_AMPQU|nr:SEN1 N terminal-domain-containing protein [Ampelomyces quisqualis]
MADLLEKISELRELPENQHLFCPRIGDEGAVYFPEDIAGLPPETDPAELKDRSLKVHEAEERKWTALKAMEIVAFDGDEAKPHKDWLMSRHNKFMQSCDICIRVFHMSRAEWRTRLEDTYDEDNIIAFLRLVDDTSAGRIRPGLEEANTLLSNAEPKARTMRLLQPKSTYAFFEALSFDTLLRDEAQLREYFDAPFNLVQTKKRLKLQTYLPAMTRFLFSKDPNRLDWATKSWVGFKRNMLKSEFEWAVQGHLRDVMDKVQMNNLDLSYVPLFWVGVRLIIERMDKELISECISSVDRGFYRLMLDHMSLRSEGFFELLATMKLILERAPLDFWDGMNAVTPSNASVAEQVFNSPILKQVLAAATDSEEDMQNVEAALSWISPFLASVKVSNLGPTVRPFAYALFERYQTEQYSPTSRDFCFRQGMKVLTYAFKAMGEYNQPADFVGQVTVNNMLEMLTSHIKLLVTKYQQFKSTKGQEVDLDLALSVIQYAFQLEAKSLVVERQLISSKMPSPTETPSSTAIWKTVLGAIKSSNLDLAIHLLIAGRTLIGVEPLLMKSAVEKVPPTVRHFNDRFKILSQSVTDVVDRLSDFNPGQLQNLFDNPSAASAIVSLLFSSTEDTRSSVVELLKVISLEDERRNALQHVLKTHYRNVLCGLSDSVRQVKQKKSFAPAPSMIKTCADIIDVMCNSQNGILRSRDLESGELGATLNFWRSLWDMLTMLFNTTEAWSNLGYYDKTMMMNFCRDTMQFADQLFDQYSVFVTALKGSTISTEDEDSKSDLLKELLAEPAGAMDGFAKWLRLRDEFLSSRSVTLISKLLIRLHNVSIEITAETLSYMERVLSGDVRAKLSTTQQAELQQALETHLGRSLSKEDEPVQPKQGSLSKWMSTGMASMDGKAKLLGSITSGATAFQQRRDQSRANDVAKAAREKALADEKNVQQEEFRKRRQLEKQKREQEKAAAIAKARQARGIPSHIAEAGSGLEGLGVLGKDQAAKGEGLMHSSDESEASDGDFDEEIFGIQKIKGKAGPKTNIVNEVKVQMPTKKKRAVRSIKDMRARLAPDLTSLHRAILGWDYFHEGDFPPNSKPGIYLKVPSKFDNPAKYQSTFEPLLTLEAWQGFVKAREEGQNKPYEIRITTRLAVDSFAEVGSTMTHIENRDVSVSEGDIILLSRSRNPTASEPTCLARIFKVKRKQQHIEVSYRVTPSNPLGPSLQPNKAVYGTKIQSITPLEREYGALKGLQYYDLCDEIIRAKPSPLLTYSDKHTGPLIQNYNVNRAQAKAIKSAIDNDAFTLIQGPPGSGKTKTITAIVGAILSDTLRNRGTTVAVPGQQRSEAVSKKLLVCAPSNAAVDELVMRFKNGIRTLNGQERKINIVRLGRSDAMNANVQDVCLEELVSMKLGMSTKDNDDREETRKIFSDHKEVSARIKQGQEQYNSGEIKGDEAQKLEADLAQLRRQKAALGRKIDNIKDAEQSTKRNADMDRIKAQQAILNDAHVICATLSGSGHTMFQNLSIEFETVIIDEAAQCVEMSALIPLKYGCAKCILVGDPKQLPPTVFSKAAQGYQYEQSLFVRMQKNHPNDVHLLDTQYRMHPEISLFPSRAFYDGKLLDGGDMGASRKQPWHKSMLLGPYRFFDVQGQHQAAPQGHSLINLAEIDIAMKLYKRLTSDFPDYNFRGKVGIITPYKSQLRELKNRFSRTYGDTILADIEFNTTDAFQGRESEIIIFSCVRASPSGGIGFLQDVRRMNVGLTRAKSSMWVLGNSQSLERGHFWRDLVVDAKERKRYTTGDLHSMLNHHSSKFPAPKEGYEQLHRPIEVKSEPMSRSASGQWNNMDHKPIKQEFKQEIKQEIGEEPTLVHHPKRKAESHGDFDFFKDDDTGDIDMGDAPSDSASNTLNGGSGRSTPAASSDAPRRSETPGTGAGNAEPGMGHVMSAMSKPKVRLQPRKPASPFIKKKKPRTG